jgi:hypothetical protein
VKSFAEEATRLLDSARYTARDAKRLKRLEEIKERHLQYFRTMSGVLAKLETVATKELNAQPLTPEEQAFIQKTIDKRGNVRIGSGRRPHYDGWYCDLVYDGLTPPMTPMKWDPTIVDVHTDPESRTVLELGVGDVNLCVISIDNEKDRTAYVGPIFSYYEFRHPAEDRLTDQQWQNMISKGQLPNRPEWTHVFQAPAKKRPKDGIPAMTKRSGRTSRRIPNQRQSLPHTGGLQEPPATSWMMVVGALMTPKDRLRSMVLTIGLFGLVWYGWQQHRSLASQHSPLQGFLTRPEKPTASHRSRTPARLLSSPRNRGYP